MSQQSGIVVLIDVEAAVAAGHLEGNVYFVDNQKWIGSTGEGTGHLVTAVDGVRARAQVDPHVMNWLAYGIAAPPASLPKSFFVRQTESPTRGLAFVPRLMDIMGNDVDESLVSGRTDILGTESVAEERSYASDLVPPTPQIVRIWGEAVDRGVMFPAQYGSPDLFSEGLYWSASVNTDILGVFSYTLDIALYYPSTTDSDSMWDWVVMPCESHIRVTNEHIVNGFQENPAIIPAC